MPKALCTAPDHVLCSIYSVSPGLKPWVTSVKANQTTQYNPWGVLQIQSQYNPWGVLQIQSQYNSWGVLQKPSKVFQFV